MAVSNSPPLTVVIATPDNFATIRRTVGYLRAQTVRAHLELLILARSQSTIRAEPGELDGFRRVKVLELGELRNAGTVKSAGVHGASAPVIAFR